MFLHDRRMRRAQFGARRIHFCAGGEAREDFGHPVLASLDHRGGKVVRTRHHVCDQFRFGGIWIGWLQHTDDRCAARPEANRFAEDRGIALKPRGPESVRQYRRAGGRRTVVCSV